MSSLPRLLETSDLPSLSIYRPDDLGSELPTLRDIFNDIVEPKMIEDCCTKEAIADVRRAVDRWEAYWLVNRDWRPALSKWSRSVQSENRILNPVLTIGVTVAHLEHWRMHGLPSSSSPRTRNKYVGAIQSILKACNRHDVPTSHARADSLPQAEAVKYYLTAEQLCQMWPYADQLQWPKVDGITTADWWRSLVAMYWTYGFRLQDLFDVKANRQVPPLQWSAITRDPLTPNPDGHARHELGWLSYTPSKTRRHRPTPLYLPITRVADAALRRFALMGGSGSIVKAPRCARDFYAEWYRWQELAGVADRKAQPFVPYSLRKSAATYLDHHFPGLADAVIGWSNNSGKSKMSREVYASTEPTLVTHLPTYRYPDCFADFV